MTVALSIACPIRLLGPHERPRGRMGVAVAPGHDDPLRRIVRVVDPLQCRPGTQGDRASDFLAEGELSTEEYREHIGELQ
jgi:hypothetical protein